MTKTLPVRCIGGPDGEGVFQPLCGWTGRRRAYWIGGTPAVNCDTPCPRCDGQVELTARRTHGAPWRILVHERLRVGGRLEYGTAHHVSDDPAFGGLVPDGPHVNNLTLPATEFDELVIAGWLHIEEMSEYHWWMDIGGLRVEVDVTADGKPAAIVVFGPEDPVPGCVYRSLWDGGEVPE